MCYFLCSREECWLSIYAAIRAAGLKTLAGNGKGGIQAAERHAKRLDPVSQKRHVRDSDPIAWSKAESGALDYVEAFRAHKRETGAGERKGADLGLEFKVIVSPEWLAESGDPHDASNPRVQQLVAEAKAWAESWGGEGAVWGLRYDTDERGSGVVDVFMSPVREQRHKSGKSKKVISCRKAKQELLEAERALEPDLRTSGAAMQSSWARWAQERLDHRLERGKPKIETGAEHENADLYARIATQKEADLLREEARLLTEEYALENREAELWEREIEDQTELDWAYQELAQRKAAQAERERRFTAIFEESKKTVAAFRAGEISAVVPSTKNPGMLTAKLGRKVSDERRKELQAMWKLTAGSTRELLAEMSAERLAMQQREAALQDQEAVFQAAKDEVSRGLRDDFDTLKVAWARNEATYNVSTAGNWRWWLDDGLTVDRRNRLQDCIKTVGGLVGWMARRFEDTMNVVVRYMSKPAQAEFKSEWIDALDRDEDLAWDGLGDGPNGVFGGGGGGGPSLGM